MPSIQNCANLRQYVYIHMNKHMQSIHTYANWGQYCIHRYGKKHMQSTLSCPNRRPYVYIHMQKHMQSTHTVTCKINGNFQRFSTAFIQVYFWNSVGTFPIYFASRTSYSNWRQYVYIRMTEDMQSTHRYANGRQCV